MMRNADVCMRADRLYFLSIDDEDDDEQEEEKDKEENARAYSCSLARKLLLSVYLESTRRLLLTSLVSASSGSSSMLAIFSLDSGEQRKKERMKHTR